MTKSPHADNSTFLPFEMTMDSILSGIIHKDPSSKAKGIRKRLANKKELFLCPLYREGFVLAILRNRVPAIEIDPACMHL